MKQKPAEPTDAELQRKEEAVRHVLQQEGTRKFLEIGIGSVPIIDRIRMMQQRGIEYHACDFASVCGKHEQIIRSAGLTTTGIHFRSNEVGTYAWTLFEMATQSAGQFDAIYLDGHHTFYIDLPAFMLADWLLKPGGYLVIDDTAWTLDLIRKLMYEEYGHWYFYHPIYRFDEYSREQQMAPHIGMIANEWLVKTRGYQKVDEWSSEYWWTTVKPI